MKGWVIWLLALSALVGVTQGFTPQGLVDELGKIPVVKVVQVNEIAWTLVFNSSGIGPALLELCLRYRAS